GWWWYWKAFWVVATPASEAFPAAAPASLEICAAATASFQPPEYQAQVMFLSERRSPMVGNVWLGMSVFGSATLFGCGVLTEKEVLTTNPSLVTWPSLTGNPVTGSRARFCVVGSIVATIEAGAPMYDGVAAAMSHM